MRVGARLAGAKLTLLPRSSTTGRTMDGEYLFWAEFFFHLGKIMPLNRCTRMVNFEQIVEIPNHLAVVWPCLGPPPSFNATCPVLTMVVYYQWSKVE